MFLEGSVGVAAFGKYTVSDHCFQGRNVLSLLPKPPQKHKLF